MSVIIFSRDLSLNTDLWAAARPHTVSRPLEEFWAERFLVPDRPAANVKKTTPERIGEGRFSTEGVGALNVTFGGGQQMCSGHYLARAIQAATLAVLLSEFDIQLSDPEDADRMLPPPRELIVGSAKPLGDVRIRIRKRASKNAQVS